MVTHNCRITQEKSAMDSEPIYRRGAEIAENIQAIINLWNPWLLRIRAYFFIYYLPDTFRG